jgi:hypothetical protein
MAVDAFSAGNAHWERDLAHNYQPNTTARQVNPNDTQRHLIYLDERSISNRLSKRKHLLQYIETLSARVMMREEEGRGGKRLRSAVEGGGKRRTRGDCPRGLGTATEAVRDESGVRNEVGSVKDANAEDRKGIDTS